MPTLAQLREERLGWIRDMSESGIGEMTGRMKIRPSYAFSGPDEVVGRYGGLNIRELERAEVSPGVAAQAIRRGKGKVFDRISKAVDAEIFRSGFVEPKKRSRGRLSIMPHHRVTRKCKLCEVQHSKREHRFHGSGAYHQTHLFSFPMGNPMKCNNEKTPALFKKYLTHLGYMPAALRPDLVEALYIVHMKKRETREAYLKWQQRGIEHGSLFNPRRRRRQKNPVKRGRGFTFHGSFTSLLLARKKERAIPGSFIHSKNGRYYVLKPKRVLSNPRRKRARQNPNGLVKIYGRVLRVEAQKTQPHRCDAACKRANHCYYHDFKTGPALYGLPGQNELRIK